MTTSTLESVQEYTEPDYLPLTDAEVRGAIDNVIEDPAERNKWLDTPHVRLGLQTPREVLDDAAGHAPEYRELKVLLEQIRAGIFS